MVLAKERKEELLLQKKERDRERTKRYCIKKNDEHDSQKPGRPKVKKRNLRKNIKSVQQRKSRNMRKINNQQEQLKKDSMREKKQIETAKSKRTKGKVPEN